MIVEPDADPRAAAAALIAEATALPAPATAAMRALRRSRSARWRGREPGFILEVARELQRRRACRWMGYELIRHHRAAFTAVTDTMLEELAIGLESWDSVDGFGRILSGPAWAHGLASNALIDRWSRSGDRWLRRTALVSTIALNRPADGGRGDPERTLAICRQLAGDPDDMVVKALSWALRVLSGEDAAAVRRFLVAEDARMAARVKREVRHKLDTGLKTPRGTG